VLARQDALLGPGRTEQRELLVRAVDLARLGARLVARAAAALVLLADDRVRQAVGEPDRRHVVVLRGRAVGRVPAFLRAGGETRKSAIGAAAETTTTTTTTTR